MSKPVLRQGNSSALPKSPNHNFQREFFKLAGVYLGCRLRAMGGDVTGLEPRKGPLHFSLLGMRDYAREMYLLIQEAQVNIISATAPAAKPKPI